MKVTSRFELRPFVDQVKEELERLDHGLIGTMGQENPTYREKMFEEYGRAVGMLTVLANVVDGIPEEEMTPRLGCLRKVFHLLDRTWYLSDTDTRQTASIALVYVKDFLKELPEEEEREDEEDEDEE